MTLFNSLLIKSLALLQWWHKRHIFEKHSIFLTYLSCWEIWTNSPELISGRCFCKWRLSSLHRENKWLPIKWLHRPTSIPLPRFECLALFRNMQLMQNGKRRPTVMFHSTFRYMYPDCHLILHVEVVVVIEVGRLTRVSVVDSFSAKYSMTANATWLQTQHDCKCYPLVEKLDIFVSSCILDQKTTIISNMSEKATHYNLQRRYGFHIILSVVCVKKALYSAALQTLGHSKLRVSSSIFANGMEIFIHHLWRWREVASQFGCGGRFQVADPLCLF